MQSTRATGSATQCSAVQSRAGVCGRCIREEDTMANRFVAVSLLLVSVSVQCLHARTADTSEPGSAASQGHRSRRDLDWNGAIDVILRHAKQEIQTQQKGRVALPDVCEDFKRKKGFVRVKGEFRATGGWLEDFSSLGRIGDVTVTKDGSAVLMTAVLGLSDLRLGYSHYEVELWGSGPDGTIEGRVGKNSIRFVVKFDMVNGECQTTLQDVNIVEFDDFDVNVSGLGSFDFLAEKVVEWLTNKRRDDIKASIEKKLRVEIEKGLEEFYCDEYSTLLMLPL